MIGRTISHYKILEKLGEGGMGAVYLAKDTSLGRKVAVKFLSSDKASDPESRKRFIHEARAQAMLSHPNIATFHEVGEEQDKVFIVMEYIEGLPLSKLTQAEKLSLPEILDLAIQVGEGLSAAHEKGVVHRDIKPENVLVTSKHHAKITDFGLAKWKGATTLTVSGTRLGTAYYMSPEQVESRKVDFRTDIFSLGIILYELLCARRPFEGDSEQAIFYELLNSQPQPLARYARNLPEKLEQIVMKCLAKRPEERYQSAADLVADLRKEKKDLEYARTPVVPRPETVQKPNKKILKILVPTSAAAVLVLLFLIFNPFKLEFSRDQNAEASQNTLAVMYFENIADPEDKDKTAQMMTSLLITGLSESENLRVISRQRLYDILNLMGKGDVKVIDRKLASEVAKKAGARWILTGEVLQTKPNFVVTGEVSEVGGGRVLASQRVNGASNEDIFAVVDKLGWDLKKNLSLPLQTDAKMALPLTEVTTHSPEAYRYYLEGVDYRYKAYTQEALKSFKKAIELDSTFALAYYQLAQIQGLSPEAISAITQASKYSSKLSQLEKRYIKGSRALLLGNLPLAIKEFKEITVRYPEEKQAFLQVGVIYKHAGQPKEEIQQLTKAIEIDPLFKFAYNELAYAYDNIGDLDKSIWAINKYISLAPDEANPYDTRGDLYANNGKIDLAVESYKKALEKKPDFEGSLNKLGYMYLLKGEYVRAESCYQVLAFQSDKNIRSGGKVLLAGIPLYRGKFEEALQVLDQGIAADKLEKNEGFLPAYKHFLKSLIYEERGDLRLALEECEKMMTMIRKENPGDRLYGRHFYVQFLVEAGDFARAEKIAQALKEDFEKKDTTHMWSYWCAIGWIELDKGNLAASIANFEKAVRSAPVSADEFLPRFILAKTYLEANRLDEAVAEFEKILSMKVFIQFANTLYRVYGTPSTVKSHYFLGLAYEKSGWNKKAIENYEEFLEIWKNADPGIAEVEDAKQRLKRLKPHPLLR